MRCCDCWIDLAASGGGGISNACALVKGESVFSGDSGTGGKGRPALVELCGGDSTAGGEDRWPLCRRSFCSSEALYSLSWLCEAADAGKRPRFFTSRL